MTLRTRTIVVVSVAAVFGLALFGFLASRAVSILETDAAGAQDSFEEALASVPSPVPLVRRDSSGRFVRDESPRTNGSATELHVLAYYVDGHRLVRGSVPLWWFKIKGPAMAYALRGTGFDLDTLGLTARDLEQAGPAIVLDERRTGGDRLLAWTT